MKKFEIMKAQNGYLIFEDMDYSRGTYANLFVFENLDEALAFLKEKYEALKEENLK